MSDIKILSDEYGRPHPVKAEDLFEYGIEMDGDTIATGVVKSKHIVLNQPISSELGGPEEGVLHVITKQVSLPAGSIVHRIGGHVTRAWTWDGVEIDQSSAYAYVYVGVPGEFDSIVSQWSVDGIARNAWGADDDDDNGEYIITAYATCEKNGNQGGQLHVILHYTVPTETAAQNEWVID